MNIHNIYSDLMLTLANYINGIIPTRIKNFQFNLASTSFRLDLSPQFELPSGIVNLTAINPVINHPYVFHRQFSNIHDVPALYNKSKDIDILLQEEIYTVNIDYIINCESQIQALNIHHSIINWLPVNKPLRLYQFVSFFEIDSILLNRFLFDAENDQIQNLFLKHNRYSDTLDYCFSMLYEPLIKLSSSTIDISTITSSSFQVVNSFEITSQLPIYIKSPIITFSKNKFPVHKKIFFTNLAVGLVQIPYLIVEFQTTGGVVEPQLFPLLDISPIGEFSFRVPFGTIFGTFPSKRTIYNCEIFYNNNRYECRVIEEYNYSTFITTYTIVDEISGRLSNTIIFADEIEGWFDGFIDNVHIIDKLKFHITNQIFEYPQIRVDFRIEGYRVLTYRIINNNENRISDFILKINRYGVKLNGSNSTVSAILIYDKNIHTYETILLDNPVILNGILSFTYNFTSYSFDVTVSEDSFIIKYLDLLPNSDDIQLLAVNFNRLQFDSIIGVHPGYVETLNVDFSYNNEVVSSVVPFQNYAESLFSNINIIIETLEYVFDENTRKYTITLNPYNYISPNLDNLTWRFICESYIIKSEDGLTEIIFDRSSSNYDTLKFIVDEPLFMTFFNRVTKLTPLFCSFN